MRKSRNQLAKDIDKMVKLRNGNKTLKEIADIMGYKSAGTVSDLLKHRGYFSFMLSQIEIDYLVDVIGGQPKTTIGQRILQKLNKKGGKNEVSA